jgi:UDP-2-acetamido-3-amino-2,3-dideoxy-glucuronate N-acetyltransferase
MPNPPTVAVIGCGHWGRNLVRNFDALGVLALVCDPTEAGRRTARQAAPDVRVSTSFEDALSAADVTAVAIAAPAVTHYELTKAALEAGEDVLVEKPLCLEVKQAEEVGTLARERERVLMVGHLLQYHPCVEKLLSLLAKGELGRLHYITSNRLNLGKIRREENALWSFAPHDVSVILALAGNRLPEHVICTGGAYLNDGVADTTLMAMQFPGGIGAHVYVSWLNPFKEQKLTVVGSNGMLVFDDARPWAEKLVLYRQPIYWTNGQIPTASKTQGEPIPVDEAEPLGQECRHFLECCTERRRPRTDAEEGLRVLRVLETGQASLEGNGQSVDPNRLKADTPARHYFIHPTAV